MMLFLVTHKGEMILEGKTMPHFYVFPSGLISFLTPISVGITAFVQRSIGPAHLMPKEVLLQHILRPNKYWSNISDPKKYWSTTFNTQRSIGPTHITPIVASVQL